MSLEIHDAEQTRRPSQKSARLKRRLLAEMTLGYYKPGAVLPSQECLAERFGVSRPTVRRTLAEMEQEGLVHREERQGTFVSENLPQQPQNTTGSFALLIPGAHDIEALSLIRGFELGCRAVDHAMVLSDSENDFHQQGETILRLSQMNIAGVAMMPVIGRPTPSYHITAFHKQNIPVVLCHRGVEDVSAPVLAVPHEDEGFLVGRAFAEQRHRRVAMLIACQADALRDKWARGMRKALQTVGGELPDEFIFTCKTSSLDYDTHEEELVEVLKRMFSAEHPPTAIYVVPDDFAQSVYFVLRQLGLRVPEDVSLVGLGDVVRNNAFAKRLTSVAIDGAKLTEQAAELLSEMRSGKRDLHDTETITIPISLTDGRTLGPAPEQKAENSQIKTEKRLCRTLAVGT